MTVVSDEQLLADYVAGDPSAFAELVRRFEQELFAFLQRFVADAATAEDLFQETFIQVHRNARSFDPQRRLRPWLFTIAANKARDHLRSHNRRSTQSLDNSPGGPNTPESTTFLDLMQSPTPPPPDTLTSAEDIAHVQQVLMEIPPLYREVLLLSYFHRFPYQHIADMLSIPLGTVKSRLHTALAIFAKTYKTRFGPY